MSGFVEKQVRRCIPWAIVAAVTSSAWSQEVDFANDIQTVLARRCFACHGPDIQEGGIRFDARDSLIAEADSGELPIEAGNAAASEIIRRVRSSDESERMPPEGKPLSEEAIQALERWIDSGAEFTEHWAFQPIQDPEIPQVKNSTWPQAPLDYFVLSKLEAADMAPVERVSPRKLVRRAFIDITGLPPSPEQVEEVVSKWSGSSFEQLVERLLADSAFGERWARTWLDVVRYAETNSFERDGPKPNAWKYRDYVIAAMNSDKPYDHFLKEQLAGDELDHVTTESLTATGYYRLGLWDDEPADPKQALFDGFDDLVTTTTQGMLGLTLNCARCHDHKIDPLTQKDYYSMVAFLRDVTPYGTRGDKEGFNQLDIDPEVARQHKGLQERIRELERKTKKLERQAIVKMSSTDQRATEGPERAQVLKQKIADYMKASAFEEYTNLKHELEAARKKKRELPPRETVLGLAKLEASPPQTFLLTRGSPHAEGEPVEPAFPKLLGGGTPSIPAREESMTSAGRRRVLADWIASDDNWMTARVIANRIWLHYFGRGIVRSPNNFGLMGDPPSHPKLLDHLATELIKHDWSLKHLHRTILLSSTYQLATSDHEAYRAQDPNNNLFWRQNMRRLSAEQLRDSVLAVTGQLNGQHFGESMYPTLSAEVLASQSRPGSGWNKSSEQDQARRSIYIHVKRSLPVPMLNAFDFPDTDISCEARFLTMQPGQALSMLNSSWMQAQAAAFSSRVAREAGESIQAQASHALELALCSPAKPGDVEELLGLVTRLQEEHDLSEPEARRAMFLVVLNLNEFLYLD